jgi:DNA repair protein RecO (recombination protein O)
VAVVETEALILRNYNLSDADKIAVFLTRGHGIIKGVAKGAKKLNSRFGSLLEPFTAVDLTYFIKDDHELASIRELELRQSFFHTSTNLEVLKTLAYFGKLLMEFVPPNEQSEKVFRMVSACLEGIAKYPGKLEQATLYFETWLLKLSGFLPDWTKCSECGRAFAEADDAVMDGTFHLTCQSCQPYNRVPHITARQRSLLAMVKIVAPKEFIEQAAVDAKECSELSVNLRMLVAHILGREIENPKYYMPEEILGDAAKIV